MRFFYFCYAKTTCIIHSCKFVALGFESDFTSVTTGTTFSFLSRHVTNDHDKRKQSHHNACMRWLLPLPLIEELTVWVRSKQCLSYSGQGTGFE